VRAEAPAEQIRAQAQQIQRRMNPHPAGQVQLNVPVLDGVLVPGVQHKYRDTVLFFPTEGQTCHAYCTYCFRWAQFVGLDDLKFANREATLFASYLRRNPDVADVLFTGGDPLTMRTVVLRRYIEAILSPELAHVSTIRIGTKALAFWPYRFLTDPDADELLQLFEEVIQSGRHLTIMSHYSHPREMETPMASEALKRVLRTGATVRCQAPLIRRVNDRPEVWAQLWREQVRQGAIPYYMFVERDTGPKSYFEVPLAQGLEIYQRAGAALSGIARTARGPAMSATPGKILLEGVTEIQGEKVFVLKFLRARDPAWLDQIFFARFDPKACWLNHLRPAFGKPNFFFEEPATAQRAARV
jgi:KamA family protein